MAKHAETFSCKVKLWGEDVGYLVDHHGDISFSYDKAFLSSGYELSPILMPLREGLFVHENNGETFQGLMGTFSDSLPDFYGRQVVKAYFKAKYGSENRFVSPIQQLTYIGSRGLGALEYLPQDQPSAQFSEALEISYLVSQAKKILEGDFVVDATAVITSIMQSNSVAGGARPKALIGWDRVTNTIIAGVPPLADEYENWLIKFDATGGVSEPFGRAEYVYSKIARECGIAMHDTLLIRERGNAHFLTKRFDRESNETRHMHSLCGMTHVDYMKKQGLDYEDFFNVVQRVTKDHREVVEAFRRMVFNFVGRNQDDHSKNFAFLMDKSGEWKLSPAYDLSYAFRPDSEWVSQHLMTINGKSMDPTKKDLLKLAKAFDIKNPQDIIEQVEIAFAKWPQYAKEEGIDRAFTKLVSSNLRMSDKASVYLQKELNEKNVIADSYEALSANPATQLKFLRDAIECAKTMQEEAGFVPTSFWEQVEIGGQIFSHRDHLTALEKTSYSWDWGSVSDQVKSDLIAAVDTLYAIDANHDIGGSIIGFELLRVTMLDSKDSPHIKDGETEIVCYPNS